MPKNYVGFRKKLTEEVFDGGPNADTPQCPRCGTTMQFHGGALPIGQGYWQCPSCSFSTNEKEINLYFDRYMDGTL